MIQDFNETGFDHSVKYDLVIVGAGAAGISLAKSLMNSKLKVCLLEGGDKTPSTKSQKIYKGENTGRDYFPLDEARLRFLGGSTNHWEGMCTPLMPGDFVARKDIDDLENISHTGWPMSFAELDKYYGQAVEFLGLGDTVFDSELVQYVHDGEPVFQENTFKFNFWRQTPFTHRFLRLAHEEWLKASPNIHLFLNANVTHIQHHHNEPRVESLTVQSFGGKIEKIQAQEYVLACGGIETPRLLLASSDRVPEGVGNSSGLVGRYFMEHVEVYAGQIVSATQAMDKYIALGAKQYTTAEGVDVHPGFSLDPQEQQRLGILHCGLAVQVMRDPKSPVTAVKSLTHDVKAGEWPDNAFTNAWRIISGVDTLYNEYQVRKGKGDNSEDMVTGIFARSEQAPNYNSYVKLDPLKKDHFGMPRVQLNWQLADIDLQTIKKTTVAFGAELARQKLGRVKLLDWLVDEQWSQDTVGGWHHLGTTRMSQNPQSGVVDSTLKVHDVNNLSVLSSSVFPTGGYANPTLTIIALAYRLGDRLQNEINVEAQVS